MMTSEAGYVHPTPREDGITFEEIGEEYVVYDAESQRAHRLNPVAAAVWRNCDGTRSEEALTELVSRELDSCDPDEVEALVDLALIELRSAGLLREADPCACEDEAPLDDATRVDDGWLTRRDALRKIGGMGAAASLLPLITTVLAPTPAMARSSDSKSGGGGPGSGGESGTSGSGGGGGQSGSGGGGGGGGRGGGGGGNRGSGRTKWWCNPSHPRCHTALGALFRWMYGC